MKDVISLQSSCVLTVISEVQWYSADTLSLLPPKLRSLVLLHLPAVDLYRISQHEGVWIGVPFTSEDVWKFRFETTLQKYTNVSSSTVEEMTSEVSWLDRYLFSCLYNVPVYYQTSTSQPSFGAAFFVTSDIVLNDVGTVKLKSGARQHGLIALNSRSKSELSSHFVSEWYQQKLMSYPFDSPVGAELSTYERIKAMLSVFPDWKPAVIPLEVDYQDLKDDVSDYDKSLCSSFVSNIKTVHLLSKYLRLHPNAEVENPADTPISSVGQFCSYIVGLLKDHKSASCSRLVISQPAMKKEVFRDNTDIDSESSLLFTHLSFSASELLEWFFQHFPNVSEISVSMHDSNQDTWNCPVFQQATLKSLQLKVIRPTFKHIVVPSLGFSSITEISLHGLAILDKEFCGIMLSVLNSPNEQKLRLANVFVKESQGSDAPVISPQVMRDACRYKTSIHFHRVKGISSVRSVFSSYGEIWLNDLSFYLVDVAPPFPETTPINCKSIHAERFPLSRENLNILYPVFVRAGSVSLSLGSVAVLSTADYVVAQICQCIQLCEKNLVYLDCKHAYNYVGLNAQHMDRFFSTVFSMPTSSLINLVFNPSRLIDSFSSVAFFQGANRSLLLSFQQIQRQSHSEAGELKHKISCWHLLCEVWKRENHDRSKIKRLCGVSGPVLNEIEDELHELCENLNM